MASDAQSALNWLRIYPVDLIIVDVTMPNINGFQFVSKIKNNPQMLAPPVAFLSARTEAKDVVRAGELGADLYITKPINRDDYLKKINSFFEKHPPRPYPQFTFAKHSAADGRLSCSVEIISISDLFVEVLIDKPIEVDQVIELSSAVFMEIPLKNPLLRVVSIVREGNSQRASLMFLDLDTIATRKIQRWIAYRNL